ncbi:hypothetical protein SB677_20220, partial [Bacillus sp. SIMBA_033]
MEKFYLSHECVKEFRGMCGVRRLIFFAGKVLVDNGVVKEHCVAHCTLPEAFLQHEILLPDEFDYLVVHLG